ncbi:MAG TPA: NIPSNAP family protein [Pseudoxanthomonas sp.]|nr:NIPSNAP family protein [Pseudoxanthomonas sp.]
MSILGIGYRPASRLAIAGSLIVLLALQAVCTRTSFASEPTAQRPIQELRIYEVVERNKQAFHERFRDHAARIMARHGFRIVAEWETRFEGRTEFVYLLEWPDEATMKSRWAAFRADEEWQRIKLESVKAHGDVMGGIEDRVLYPTDYSPRSRFTD